MNMLYMNWIQYQEIYIQNITKGFYLNPMVKCYDEQNGGLSSLQLQSSFVAEPEFNLFRSKPFLQHLIKGK